MSYWQAFPQRTCRNIISGEDNCNCPFLFGNCSSKESPLLESFTKYILISVSGPKTLLTGPLPLFTLHYENKPGLRQHHKPAPAKTSHNTLPAMAP